MSIVTLVFVCFILAVSAVDGNMDNSEETKLLSRIKPWKFVNRSESVYLMKWTKGDPRLQYLTCVRSKYLGYKSENLTVYRTLEATFNGTRTISLNMSLDVHYSPKLYPPILHVRLLHSMQNLTLMSEVVVDEYKFPVGFSDIKCLILGNSEKGEENTTGCSMWVTEHYYEKRSLCCDFIFFLICGSSGTPYELPKCPRESTPPAC
uniref:Lipocalin/cytosolic fatty-acid binding domain-containing protein n=1 Tax=Amblyomma maculatum TaxID=34609 RepID=G3MP04_AMBMU